MSPTRAPAGASGFRCSILLIVIAGCTAPDQRDDRPAVRTAGLSDPSAITPEVMLAAGAPITAHGEQDHPAVAHGGDVRLVAWLSDFGLPTVVRVRASDGAPLDPAGIVLVAPAPADVTCGPAAGRVAVGFTDGVFLVAWATFYQVCGVRIRPDGTVLDATPRVIAGQRQDLDAPAVSGDGTNFLVVWGDGGGSGPGGSGPANADEVRGARLRASDGVALDGDGFVIADGPAVQNRPAVTFDGTNFFVAWSDSALGAMATRVRPSDRQLLDVPAIVLAGPGAGRPTVAYNGTHVAAVWQWAGAFVGRRFNPTSGAAVDASPVMIRDGVTAPNVSTDPAISHDGTNFAVVWRGAEVSGGTTARLNVLRFDGALAPIGSPVTVDSEPGSSPFYTRQAISSSAGKHFVVWNRASSRMDNFNNYLRSVHGATVDGASGAAGDAAVVSRQAPPQSRPNLSFDGRQHLAVWQEWDGSQFHIRAARLRDSDGSLLDPTGMAISTATGNHQIYGLTASNGVTHLVVWWDGTRLRAVRVRGDDGAILDSPPLSLPAVPGVTAIDSPRFDVKSDGTDYLVLFAAGSGMVSLSSVRIRGSDGVVLDAAPRPVVDPIANLSYVALGYVQSHYLAAWKESSGGGNPQSLRARRLDRDGTPLDPIVTVRQAPFFVERTQITAVGGVAMVHWSELGQDSAARVRMSDATLLDTTPIALLRSGQWSYHVTSTAAFDGEHVLKIADADRPIVLRLQRITPEGNVLDPQGVVVSAASAWPSTDVALSPSPGRRTLLAYTRFEPTAGVFSERVRFRWLGDLPPPPPPPDPPPPPPVDPPLPVDAAPPPVDAPVPPPVDAPLPPPVDAPVPPPVDAPVPPPVDAQVPPPVDAPVPPPVDAPVSSPVDGPEPTVDTSPPPDGGTADATVDAGPAPGSDASAPPSDGAAPTGDARRDGGDGAAGDGARDARGDAGPGDEEPACSCDLGARRQGPGSAALLMILAVAGLGARRRRRAE